MQKKYIYVVFIIIVVAIAAFVWIRDVDTKNGLEKEVLSQENLEEVSGNSASSSPASATTKPAALAGTARTLGALSYNLPEANPLNARSLPAKGYIESKIFGNYKAETILTPISISESKSWDAIGYNATIFASETKEACHAIASTTERYTNPAKTEFYVFGGSFLANDHQYTMHAYQKSIGSSCYNFGVFEEFKILESMSTKEADQKAIQAKRDAESARVNSLLKTLIDSVRIK